MTATMRPARNVACAASTTGRTTPRRGRASASAGRGVTTTTTVALLLGSTSSSTRRDTSAGRGVRAAAAVDTGIVLAGLEETLMREPGNALSIPTWFVHTSSVLEWIIAMQLVLKFAKVTGKKQYLRLAYGMLPLHGSSMCAVTYHFFYNAPALNSLVTVQAALTCFGNVTLLLAAYDIHKSLKEERGVETEAEVSGAREEDVVVEEDAVLAIAGLESDWDFSVKAFGLCFFSALAVKYGSLLISLPFNPDEGAAATIIIASTVIMGLNIKTNSG